MSLSRNIRVRNAHATVPHLLSCSAPRCNRTFSSSSGRTQHMRRKHTAPKKTETHQPSTPSGSFEPLPHISPISSPHSYRHISVNRSDSEESESRPTSPNNDQVGPDPESPKLSDDERMPYIPGSPMSSNSAGVSEYSDDVPMLYLSDDEHMPYIPGSPTSSHSAGFREYSDDVPVLYGPESPVSVPYNDFEEYDDGEPHQSHSESPTCGVHPQSTPSLSCVYHTDICGMYSLISWIMNVLTGLENIQAHLVTGMATQSRPVHLRLLVIVILVLTTGRLTEIDPNSNSPNLRSLKIKCPQSISISY